MLKERITLKEGEHVSCWVEEVEYYPIHTHPCLEIVYVIKGSLRLKYSYFDYDLPEKCMHIINCGDMHSYSRTDEDNLVLFLHLDMDDYRKRNPYEGKIIFVSGHYSVDSGNDEQLLASISEIVSALVSGNAAFPQGPTALHEAADRLISHLVNDYQYFFIDNRRFKNKNRFKGDEDKILMLRRILKYIYDNFTYHIKLSDVAEMEHVSIWHLSHLFKQAVGCSFQDFISFARVEFSEKLLLSTSRSISDISYQCGFSSPRYYTENFISWFGMNPSEYRARYKDQTIDSRDKITRVLAGAELNAAIEYMVSQFGKIEDAKVDPCSERFHSISLSEASSVPAMAHSISAQSVFQGTNRNATSGNLCDTGYMAATVVHFILKGDLKGLPALTLQDHPQDACFYGGNGLLTSDGWKKASYFAYQFLCQLGPEELSRSKCHLLTRSASGLQLLLYHYNEEFSDTGALTPLDLTIEDIDPEYAVTRYKVNSDTRLPYRLWLDMGEPDRLGAETLRLFKNIILPDFDCIRAGQSSISTTLEPFEVQLWLLEKLSS